MSVREEITEKNMISVSGMMSMNNAFINGNASPMIWLIKTLKIMLSTIKKGHIIHYFDKENNEIVIDESNFHPFVLEYFDDFVYKEIFSDSFLYDD